MTTSTPLTPFPRSLSGSGPQYKPFFVPTQGKEEQEEEQEEKEEKKKKKRLGRLSI